MQRLIVLSGPIGVGKSSFAQALQEQFDVVRISTSGYLRERTGCENTRPALQKAGEQLDDETGGAWVVDAAAGVRSAAAPDAVLLLDSARIKGQVDALRGHYSVFHTHLDASLAELEKRYLGRAADLREFETYAEAREHGTEQQVGSLAADADLVLDAEHAGPHLLASTAMAAFGFPLPPVEQLVDVIVGGQYGSEGKGNVCAHIANNYGALVRIGGPNAGHVVANPPYKYQQLPSGTGSNLSAKVLIGAGSTLWLPQLLLEILDWGLTPDRLSIDPQAMVIDDEDRRIETALASISTTGQGVGSASARKILNRGDRLIFGPPTKLARNVPELRKFVRNVRQELDTLFRERITVLLEGTQGTALSIHHGFYPHVTSRETSSAGCLSDAGISHRRVKRVIMVVRTYPIRVGNPASQSGGPMDEVATSGWMGREIDFKTIAERSRVPLEDIEKTEKGTVSGRKRRIAEFDWSQLRMASEINGATDIALTFTDYLDVSNRQATSFAELSIGTQEFIRRVDRVAGVPVTFASISRDTVLERGDWT